MDVTKDAMYAQRREFLNRYQSVLSENVVVTEGPVFAWSHGIYNHHADQSQIESDVA